MNEVVKFPINTPVEVTLQDEAGKRVEGRYGEQVMYSLLDNRVMYVPPYVEQRFKELAIGFREPLLLCKVKDSNRNRTEWSVKRAPQRPQASANGIADADSVVPAITPCLQRAVGTRETEMVASTGEIRPGEHHTVPNGAAKREEQPSANSTAPMAQELALQTNHQHQRQDSAGSTGTEIIFPAERTTALSTKDSVFLPAMSMEVALARRAAIVEFTRRIMVKDRDFGEIPGTHSPPC